MEYPEYVSTRKLKSITQEATQLKMDIFGLAEVRWLESRNLQCDSHTLIYSGHKKEHKHGVGLLLSKAVSQSVMGYHAMSDRVLVVKIHDQPFDLSIIQVYAPTSASTEEEIEDFYSDLEDAYGKCSNQDIVIFMDDMNAEVGSEQDPLKEFCLYHCMLYMCNCLFGMFTILDYSSALEYSIIRRYTNIVYYYYY